MIDVWRLLELNAGPLDHQPIMLVNLWSRKFCCCGCIFGFVVTCIAIVGVGATKGGSNKCFCGGASFGVHTGGDGGVVVLLTVSFEMAVAYLDKNTDFSFFLRLIGVTCVYPNSFLLSKAHISLFFVRIHF